MLFLLFVSQCDTVIALQTSGSASSASQSEAPLLLMGAVQLAEKKPQQKSE